MRLPISPQTWMYLRRRLFSSSKAPPISGIVQTPNNYIHIQIQNTHMYLDVFAPEIIQFIKDSPPTVDCANTQQIHTYTNTKYTYVFGCICAQDYSVHQRLPSNGGLYKHPTNTGDPLTKFKRVNKSKFENQHMARKQHSRKWTA